MSRRTLKHARFSLCDEIISRNVHISLDENGNVRGRNEYKKIVPFCLTDNKGNFERIEHKNILYKFER